MFTTEIADQTKSPVFPLISEETLAQAIEYLRSVLATDSSPEVVSELSKPAIIDLLKKYWWQRIQIPGSAATTTSDHERREISDPGFLNTLGNALTPEEGFILRPLPK
jgi:hypothetical protein